MAETLVREAEPVDPNPGPPGEMPYEMAGRPEPASLVPMDDLSGWLVECDNSEAHLYPSAEQRLWRGTTAKLVYRATGPSPSVLVRPAQPIEVPDPWDMAHAWTYGNRWGWAPDPTTPFPQAALVLEDAEGTRLELGLGGIDSIYWFPMYVRLHGEPKRPLKFVGLRLRGIGNTEDRALYLGPVCFEQEQWKPLTFAPRPATLPFPVEGQSVVPPNKVDGFTSFVRREGEAALLTYEGPDCSLTWRYEPTDGTLGDVRLEWEGRSLRPLAGGGVQLAVGGATKSPDDASVTRTLESWGVRDSEAVAQWRLECEGTVATVSYRFSIVGKSLRVAVDCEEPVVERVALGRAEGFEQAKLTWVPYWTYGGNDPRVLLADGMFVASQFDWFASNASVLYGGNQLGQGWAVFNGGAQYNAKTDGQRNPVREVLTVSASPDFHEVLPSVPNPPSPMREVMADRLWRVCSGADRQFEIDNAKLYRAYGCDKVAVRYHEDSWRDGGESFTFRLHAGPARGGDEPLRAHVAAVKELGWLVGLYTNYTDFAPVNSYWDTDRVARWPNGELMRAWMRCYAPKPNWSVEMQAELAPQIGDRYGTTHSYCDVHTAVTPFERVDYDHRVPGAGTFGQTLECYGRLLYNEKTAHHGPVYSEGRNHWWYAGLTDGNYAQIISGNPPGEALLPDFDLLRLHPLEMDAGMGAAGMFFRGPWRVDQFIATSLAYGHIGMLSWDSMAGDLENYHMMQPLQSSYVMEPVETIEYETPDGMADVSRAIATDSLGRNRVHVRYRNGCEVWVNGSAESWIVTTPEGDAELPEWGYVGRSGDGAVRVSSAVEPVAGPDTGRGPRQRACLARSPEQHYANSRGGFAFLGDLALEGAGALKKDGDSWWVIPATDFRGFGFRPELLGARNVRAIATDQDGRDLGPAEVRVSRGVAHIVRPEGDAAFKYRIEAVDEPAPRELIAESALGPIGELIPVALPDGPVPADLAPAWLIGDQTLPAEYDVTASLCRVPSSAMPGQHLWLRIGGLWTDFVAVAPYTLTLTAPAQVELAEGEPYRFGVSIESNLDRAGTAIILLSGGTGPIARHEAVLPGRARSDATMETPLERTDGPYEIGAAVEGAESASARLSLSREMRHKTVVDLLDPAVVWRKGYARRDGTEVIVEGDLDDGDFRFQTAQAGGVSRPCLFTHPPYKQGPGFTFGEVTLDLPADEPCALDFATAMRDGLDKTDGVVFRVQAKRDDGTWERLFERPWRETRWEPASVDLGRWAGAELTLRLVCDAGPADDTVADHGLWADLRVRSERTVLLVRKMP